MNFKKNLKIVRAITMCLALGTMGCINMNMVSASDNLQAPKSAFDKNYKPDMSRGADNFYQSDKVNMQKVEFKNQYNMTVVGNLFVPKNLALSCAFVIKVFSCDISSLNFSCINLVMSALILLL